MRLKALAGATVRPFAVSVLGAMVLVLGLSVAPAGADVELGLCIGENVTDGQPSERENVPKADCRARWQPNSDRVDRSPDLPPVVDKEAETQDTPRFGVVDVGDFAWVNGQCIAPSGTLSVDRMCAHLPVAPTS